MKLSDSRHFLEVISSSAELDRIILIWTLYYCEDYRKVVAIMDGWTRGEYLMSPRVLVNSLIEINDLDRASELIAERLREECSDGTIADLNEYMGTVC